MTNQTEYIAREAQALHDALTRGDRDDAALTAVTLRQELHELLHELDPEGTLTSRITRSNGTYIYPQR
ncbi:hypothetical protein GS504_03415 [Rhodococcus hoagii]|nr:hypothetical protein [Prescottella equi]NKS56605.1 hypothetical protein [Prescottella equi]